MKTKSFYVCLAALFCLAAWAHRALDGALRTSLTPSFPRRIVSLAPSITETLYALGLGDTVAGVTQFCAYPPQARTKPQVAGFDDVNYEAVLRLRPDLVVLPQDKARNKKDLEHLGLPTLPLDTLSLSGVMSAIEELGTSMGRENEAQAILAAMKNSLAAARARAGENPKSRVLFSVMHSYQGLGQITEINAVGKDGFYSELILAAGGSNAYTGDLPFPRLSREAIIFLDPQVIIDIIPASENLEEVRRDWQSLSSVSAIKNRRLYFFTDEADTIPGPRFYQTLTKLSHALHPDPPQKSME